MRLLRRNWAQQQGFTLLELMIATGFMGVLAGLVSATSLLSFKTSAESGSQIEVATEIAKSTRWLSRDIHRAITTDLEDGAPAVSSGSFTWSDAGVLTTCTYSEVSGGLVRDCGSGTFVASNGVSSLQFSRSGELISVDYTLTSNRVPVTSQDLNLKLLLGGG